jgi:hypothetical protein
MEDWGRRSKSELEMCETETFISFIIAAFVFRATFLSTSTFYPFSLSFFFPSLFFCPNIMPRPLSWDP